MSESMWEVMKVALPLDLLKKKNSYSMDGYAFIKVWFSSVVWGEIYVGHHMTIDVSEAHPELEPRSPQWIFFKHDKTHENN